MDATVRAGLNIRNLRNERDMSQEGLAFAADVDRSYISEIELAKSSASVAILERIAHAMDLDIIDLFARRD